jgi:hypothetical protein
MAGLWERIRGDAEDRIDIHLLDAAMTLYATGAFTPAQILSGLNSKLTTPLNPAEQADLQAMAAVLDPLTVLNKLVHQQKIMAWSIAAENTLVTEAQYRTALGI